ncbi:MAG: hypothetical protein GY832_44330 [Chloroflexi bacterium]|nr:hypothetical protein [Chloroflexota bacterium]
MTTSATLCTVHADWFEHTAAHSDVVNLVRRNHNIRMSLLTSFWEGVLAGYGIAIPIVAIAVLIVDHAAIL